MAPASALGLWRSDFGPVKIEMDSSGPSGRLMGIWLYERNGQEVIGFFAGNLRGNVLDITWHDPAEPQDLTGSGYVTFEPSGTTFSGKLWTQDGTRTYDWNGWRVQSPPNYGAQIPAPSSQTPPDTGIDNRSSDSPPPPPRDQSVPGNPYGY